MDKEGDKSNQSKLLYALISICFVFSGFALSNEIKTVGHDIEEIVTSSVFSLTDQHQCVQDSRVRTTITEATILFHENNLEVELRLCYSEASYTVLMSKKYDIYNDGLYLHQESKLLPTIHLITIENCQPV